MEIHFAAISDIGRVRNTNEDYYLQEKIADDEYLFVVADGMGGHQAGDVASSVACKTFFEIYSQNRKRDKPIDESIQSAILRVNAKILKLASDDIARRGMGTTFSALIVKKMRGYVVHVGDSRIYLIRRRKLQQLTTDHSFVEKLVENGQLTRDEAREHPQKNVLYMSVGAKEGFAPEYIFDLEIFDGDCFLICSDGLTNMVREEELLSIVGSELPQEAVDRLVKLANEHGGMDNITVQVISFGSWKTLEKTDPERRTVKRRKIFPLILFALLFFAVFSVYWWLRIHHQPKVTGKEVRLKQQLSEKQRSFKFQLLNISRPDLKQENIEFLTMINGELFYRQGNNLGQISIYNGNWEIKGYSTGLLPLINFRKELFYYRFKKGNKTILEMIASDGQTVLLTLEKGENGSRFSNPKRVVVTDLEETVCPLYADDSFLILKSRSRIYVVLDWLSDDFRLLEQTMNFARDFGVNMKNYEGKPTILILESLNHRLTLISGERLEQKRSYDIDIPDDPLSFELRGNEIIFYYSQEAIIWSQKKTERLNYSSSGKKLVLKNVFSDLYTDLRIAIEQSGQIYRIDLQDD